MSYAKAGRGSVAYQIVGAGGADLLIAKPPMFPIDLMRDEPGFARFLDGLSSFSRSFWFDQRGTDASDMPGEVEGRLPESMVEDMLAVLDDAHRHCYPSSVFAVWRRPARSGATWAGL
jgi:hypothetical protein